MSRLILALAGTVLAHPVLAADVMAPIAPPEAKVPILAPVYPEQERIKPLIDLPIFWSEVRRSQSVEEVAGRLMARYGAVPLVFQGINTNTGVFQRVTILRVYQRLEDAKMALPAVSFDTITDGVPRTVTIPLWSGVQVLP